MGGEGAERIGVVAALRAEGHPRAIGQGAAQALTDHSSTATHQLGRDGKRRGFNEEDLAICAHCGLEPRVINVGPPEENGNCESAHGHLKRRIKQPLLLRGSRDFASEEAYDQFLIGVLDGANRLRAERLSEELDAMPEANVVELPDYREVMVTVGNNSTVRLRKQVYSVPSRLIGTKLLARIYENRIVLMDGRVEEVSRCNPSRYVGKHVPPTIIFHGTEDRVVPYEPVVKFVNQVKKKSNVCELCLFKGRDHSLYNFNVNPEGYDTTVSEMDRFLVAQGSPPERPQSQDGAVGDW